MIDFGRIRTKRRFVSGCCNGSIKTPDSAYGNCVPTIRTNPKREPISSQMRPLRYSKFRSRGAPGGNDFWRPERSSGRVERNYNPSIEEASDEICAAIMAKYEHYSLDVRKELLFAVDVLETPGHALEQVVQHLDRAWISSLGFKQIWLVGLTPPLSVRVHP